MKNKKEVKKVSYNPFKMWLSWFGAILFLIFWVFSIPLICFDKCPSAPGFIMYILIFVIIGFLVGWAIHALIRKLGSKKK